MTLVLKRLSGFAYGHDNPSPEVWVNPLQIAYVQPRIVTRGHAEYIDGSGVLDVREPIGLVVNTLQNGRGGTCQDCDQPLRESWMSVCEPCRVTRHQGVDEDWEACTPGDPVTS
jgi:hypothetical protein